MTLVPLAPPVVLGLAANLWMFLRARKELKKTNEPWNKYFPSHRSQVAWIRGYVSLARSRGLSMWPVYVHWTAWIATAAILVLWLLHPLWMSG